MVGSKRELKRCSKGTKPIILVSVEEKSTIFHFFFSCLHDRAGIWVLITENVVVLLFLFG